ncbi:MAG: hypothetical protein EGR77_01740 [Pseudobutyrivibrio sp.]|nr:hypothetical protein [Pseudobutyrivibrio sp.]
MKKFNAQKALAHLLLVGLITTAIFPGTAYAAEVGEQMAEGQQTVMEAVASEKEQQDLVTENTDQAQNEPTQENGQTEDAASSPTVTEYTSADQVLDASAEAGEDTGRRLILTADTLPEEIYEANNVEHYDDLYLLTYETKEACAFAYDAFVSAGYVVEKDDLLDAIDQDEIPETKVQDEVTAETIDDPVPTVGTKQTLVAVIDTGISDVTNDDVFKDRIIEGTSVLSDSYLDDNGHGTAMAKIIAEDTVDENVMILPIKALDKDGKGTVLSVALAIKYAKEHGADVINLSLSGVGQSNILTNAINDCYNNGITVITAAGNDNADAKEYIPGNVDTAINIAAAEEDADGKIVSASYTNHGDNIDFAALGTYKLVVEKEKTTLETELRGTSIASAHVAAYVALLKQINATVDGVVNPISESDVMESLIASADDFDGTVNHTYFGSGFLSKDKLVFKNSETEDPDKETNKEETDEDENDEITTQGGWYYGYWMSTSQEDMVAGLFNGATHFVLMNDISFTSTWVIDAGYTFTVNGNGHQIINNVPNGGSIITVNGGYLITEGNLTLNGNYHRSGHGVGERTACVDVTGNGTWKGTDTTCCHCWNYGYSGEKNLGGGAGFNIFSQEGTGIFTNCTAYDCDGAGFYIANGELNNCKAYDCSWGVWFSKIGTNVTIKNCDFNANRCDKSKNAGTDDFYGGCGIGSCWWTTANIIDCNISGSNAAVWCGYGGIAKISGSTLHNSDYGVVSDGEVTVSSSTIRSNSQSGTLIKAGTATITNSEIYSNKYGIFNNGTVTMISGDIHNNTNYGVFNSNTFTMNNGSIYSNNYGFYNEGTAYLRGGTIYSNTHDGIRNAGNFNISGGTIKNNKYGIENGFYDEDSILKSGTMNMSGGVIQSNTQDGIYNYSGNATITGGTIKDNQRYGTYNKATMNYAGGASGGNVGYDVYQNGNYKMSGSASTYSNGVYLTKGKMIEITGALTCADGAIKVTIQRLDSTVGRTVAKCTYGMYKANADAMIGKFALQNKETRTIGADGKTFRKATLRSATGTNGTVGNIVLSEEYYVTYDGNVHNAHVTFKLPERQTIYWKEDVDVPTVGTTVYYDGRVFQSLRNVGYSKTADGKGTSCKIGQTMHFSANEVTKDQILYAQYTTAADLSINGNTQTAGDNYVIYGFVSNETALPDNTFEKIYSGIEYDENLEKDIPYKTIYSHHGWSYSDQAMYKDSGVGKCGETFDLTPRILEMINNGQESVSEEGYINNVTLYAVWDEPPKITAKNKYWNTDAIRAGKLNKEDLLRTASAKDKEDGTDVTLEVEDFDIEKFLHLGEYGWMSVRYKATDGAGNVSYKLIKVVVVQSGIVQGEFYDPNPAYVRMIDRENYNKKSHEEGGLMEDSVWYTIPTYKKTILDAFDRLDNGEAIVRYHFTCKDIREAQAYETEAMENGTYPTAAHWEAWLKKFEHCKVFDTGYRSSKELNNSIDPEDYEDYKESEE